MKAIDVRPTRGDFGLPDAAIIKTGDPYSSTLYFRMAKFGRDRMPHIGSELPDEKGLRLVEQWIAGMNAPEGSSNIESDRRPFDQILADPKSALKVSRKLGRNGLTTIERDTLLSSVAKLSASPIRDLFEGYLPADEKG